MLRSLKPICLAATLAWIVGTGNAAELPLAEQETQGRAFAQKLLQLAPRQQYEGNATFLRVGPNGAEPVVRAQTPRGETVYWVGAAGAAQDAGEGTDFHAVSRSMVSLTPLQMDLTRNNQLQAVRQWMG